MDYLKKPLQVAAVQQRNAQHRPRAHTLAGGSSGLA
jgi:hypothetical protein